VLLAPIPNFHKDRYKGSIRGIRQHYTKVLCDFIISSLMPTSTVICCWFSCVTFARKRGSHLVQILPSHAETTTPSFTSSITTLYCTSLLLQFHLVTKKNCSAIPAFLALGPGDRDSISSHYNFQSFSPTSVQWVRRLFVVGG